MDTTSSPPARHGGLWLSWQLRPMLVVVLWLMAVLAGVSAMLNYEYSAGGDPSAPKRWPASSTISQVLNQATLVVFAHPRCPCTAATLDVLAEIIATTGAGTNINVLFFTPTDAGTDWTQTPAVRRASAIPGVTVVADLGGREAQLFHAATSGRTLLYDPNGTLVFDGGITDSRGHSGESLSGISLLKLMTHQSSAQTETPVYGCSILPRLTSWD
jgi:hypothetical protein